ncbi:MAG TPA: outer membrane beta-barrel protein, partial [Methylomirabilota bacterium]|nr:outer membrane beta-barrel protein [Methylomirabilota bacterium]
WGPDRRWNTQLLVSRRSNEDNGAGYFDYVRWAAGGELTHRHAGWETSLGVGLNHYNYRQNRFGTFSDRWDWSLTWSVEKRLHPRWKLRADYRREQALTDTHTDEYSVNEIAAGVVWEF